MRRFPVVSVLSALLTLVSVLFLAGCGGSGTKTPAVASITITPTTLSLNEGAVGAISATAQDSTGATVAADITFTSSNNSIATVSSGGLVCGGVWDANIINCNPTVGQSGVGQVTITATSGTATGTVTIYVHLQIDRVVTNPPNGCISMGQVVPVSASAFSTSAPGCSQSAPCDITNTVGPITIDSNDLTVVANSSGIEPTYSSTTTSPTYTSGGTITGSKGQTCNLSNFTVGGIGGIDPIFSSLTDSPTYTSGGVIIGTAGQTCNLSNFNNDVSSATAILTLTGTNTIATGTQLSITAEGSGGTAPPTTAMLTNGTASCSGTANVITQLNSTVGTGLSVVGAKATVALTGSNTIASGTQLTVTSSGYGASTPPTAATLSSGTATCSGTANVITELTPSGVFTAENPGSTTIFASVSGVNSVGVPYLTCPVVSILVHDANSSNTSFTLSSSTTQPLTADVLDSAGQAIKPTLTWSSSSSATATAAVGTQGGNPGSITAVAPGTASITASCSYPDCNKSIPNAPPPYNIPAQYSQNVVTATVSGASTTTVYAASTLSTTLIPISTSTNTVGTAITLPNLPNSMIIDPSGTNLFLGSSSGVMMVALASSVVTTLPLNGTVVAVSPNSQFLLISDSVSNNVFYFQVSTGTITSTSAGFTTTSSAYAPDSKFNEWVSGTALASGLQTGVQPGLPGNAVTTLPYKASALDISAQGGLTYITGNSPGQIDVRSTCDQSEVTPGLSANSPTLIKAIPNGTGAVATDSPAVDVVSTPAVLSMGCPVTTQSMIADPVNMGVGAFNARQLFLNSNSTRAWIISDLPQLMYLYMPSLSPMVIPYAGGATAYSGGVTLDGGYVYVGASDGTVHQINVGTNSDVGQIAVGLKDANGNAVAPNLVAVQPH
jgi:Bacterial Ig-like domain (group 2)